VARKRKRERERERGDRRLKNREEERDVWLNKWILEYYITAEEIAIRNYHPFFISLNRY